MSQSLLKLSKENNTISIHAQPLLEPSKLVERGDIYLELSALHGKGLFLFESAIDSAIAILNADKHLSPQAIVIAEQRDASLIVKTAKNNMSASITVIGAYGGRAIDGSLLIAALKQNNIVQGVRKNLLQTLLSKSHQLSSGEKITMQVALGRLPENGKDSVFELLVDDISRRVLKPRELEHDKVDMRDLGELCSVAQGQSLMKRIRATAGIDGYTVLGETLPAKPGEDKPFSFYDGAEISDYDEDLVIATQPGVPIFKKNGVQVDDALVVKNVSATTGHVNFDGSVVIQGDVKPGMKVTASGSLTVLGFVELAELEAGADITVAKGILGKQSVGDSEYACTIKSGGKITSKFAQYTLLDAKDDICLSHHALHCHITTRGKLSVIDDTKRYGTLSGGYVSVGYSVHALNIGALAGTVTSISAFTNYEHLRKQISDTCRLWDEEKEYLAQMREAQIKLLKIPTNKRPKDLVNKVVESHRLHTANLRRCKESYDKLKEEYIDVLSQVSITAAKRINAGVNCQLEKYALPVSQEHGPSIIRVKEQGIELKPL
ncbi:DUF342 domain-containing protein [Photobacterium sanguinicancri]|uniref:DUF342 domain-containing protein n=1 Tax=Photobacterium sanguinicancri TaxID=875932 RepID=UPI0021C31E89|nr:FapA family protein [Photobacterium sanguinicancri]